MCIENIVHGDTIVFYDICNSRRDGKINSYCIAREFHVPTEHLQPELPEMRVGGN